MGSIDLLLSLGYLNRLSSISIPNLKVEVSPYLISLSLVIRVSLVILLVLIIESVSEVSERLIGLLIDEVPKGYLPPRLIL